jgi:hypothetical protein
MLCFSDERLVLGTVCFSDMLSLCCGQRADAWQDHASTVASTCDHAHGK